MQAHRGAQTAAVCHPGRTPLLSPAQKARKNRNSTRSPGAAGCPAGPARQSASRAGENSLQPPPPPARSPPALRSPTRTPANEARASKRRIFPSRAAQAAAGKPHGATGWLPAAIEHQAWPKRNAPALLPASAPISREVLPPAGTAELNGHNPSGTRARRRDACPRSDVRLNKTQGRADTSNAIQKRLERL